MCGMRVPSLAGHIDVIALICDPRANCHWKLSALFMPIVHAITKTSTNNTSRWLIEERHQSRYWASDRDKVATEIAMDVRVQDYLDDKLQASADLDSLDALLSNVKEQQDLLKRQASQSHPASAPGSPF
jgi:hypothetical protein